MKKLAPFDEAALASGEAINLRAAADCVHTRLRRSVQELVEAGGYLEIIKKIVGRGHFLPWIEAEFGMGERLARKLMGAHKRLGKSANLADLKIPQEAVFLLAAPSTEPEVVEAAVAKAEAGEKIDRKGVEAIKVALKAEQGKARDLRADKQALQSQNAKLHETESDLRERVLLLGHELERSQRAQGAPVETEVNKYRATLRLVWDMTPPEDRAWLLAEVVPDA